MKLSESLSYDSENLEVFGFTDLGKFTPKNQVKVRGDHALVFLFKPFRGQWVQSLGSFLSRGCATGEILHELVLECTILLENAGFHIDVVTTDGATWNRTMWRRFGLSKFENSCEHPCGLNDKQNPRRLYFCSDFSHLLKNLRNFITSNEETWVSIHINLNCPSSIL